MYLQSNRYEPQVHDLTQKKMKRDVQLHGAEYERLVTTAARRIHPGSFGNRFQSGRILNASTVFCCCEFCLNGVRTAHNPFTRRFECCGEHYRLL